MNSRVSDKYKDFIIEEYKKIGNASAIAEKVGCHPKTVREILTKEGIPIKVLTARRKKNFNEDYFENIDTEEKAYWLGFLYADGYNYEKVSRVVIGLHEKDICVLEKFKQSINYTGNILKYPQRKNVILNLSSRKLSQDLANKGCPQNKTYKIRFPDSDIVPTYLIHHFMRGYFDGDGCITKYNYFSVISNVEFVIQYQQYLINYCNLSKLPIRHRWEHNKKVGYITYGGINNIVKLYEFLYKDASIYLERKKDIFDSIVAIKNSRKQFDCLNLEGHSIRVDEYKRICLSDIWLACGKPKNKRPAEWKRKHIHKVKLPNFEYPAYITQTGSGAMAGTFAVKEIALAYCFNINSKLYENLVSLI